MTGGDQNCFLTGLPSYRGAASASDDNYSSAAPTHRSNDNAKTSRRASGPSDGALVDPKVGSPRRAGGAPLVSTRELIARYSTRVESPLPLVPRWAATEFDEDDITTTASSAPSHAITEDPDFIKLQARARNVSQLRSMIQSTKKKMEAQKAEFNHLFSSVHAVQTQMDELESHFPPTKSDMTPPAISDGRVPPSLPKDETAAIAPLATPPHPPLAANRAGALVELRGMSTDGSIGGEWPGVRSRGATHACPWARPKASAQRLEPIRRSQKGPADSGDLTAKENKGARKGCRSSSIPRSNSTVESSSLYPSGPCETPTAPASPPLKNYPRRGPNRNPRLAVADGDTLGGSTAPLSQPSSAAPAKWGSLTPGAGRGLVGSDVL